MNHTPGVPLHCILKHPNFSRHTGTVDGDVKMRQEVQGKPDTKTAFVQPPRPDKRPHGFSFFVPQEHLSDAIHSYLGRPALGCAVTPLDMRLPKDEQAGAELRLIQDEVLFLPVGEDAEPIECGQHWTLYLHGNEVPATTYTLLYQQLMSQCLPCQQQCAAESPGLCINMDQLPSNRLTAAACLAMDSLAENSQDTSMRFFSILFAGHLRAVDPELTQAKLSPAILELAAVALEQWTVHDPLLWADSLRAQALLQSELDVETTKKVHYVPFWVSS